MWFQALHNHLLISLSVFYSRHSQYKSTRSLWDFSGNRWPAISLSFIPVTRPFFSSSHRVFFSHSSWCIHPTSQNCKESWQQPRTTYQPSQQWGGDSAEALQRSLQSAAALLTHNLPGGRSLILDTDCVHRSSCSSLLFLWEGGHVFLWTGKHGAVVQQLIMVGPVALCDLRII